MNLDCSSDASSCFRVNSIISFSFDVVNVVHSFSSSLRFDFNSSNLNKIQIRIQIKNVFCYLLVVSIDRVQS
jgi:hypothetical protein